MRLNDETRKLTPFVVQKRKYNTNPIDNINKEEAMKFENKSHSQLDYTVLQKKYMWLHRTNQLYFVLQKDNYNRIDITGKYLDK